MNKYLTTSFLFLALCLFISGCTSMNTKEKISDYNWKMESISDLGGKSSKNEMTVVFNDDNSFVLTDKSDGKERKGKYTTEKVDSSYKLELYFEDTRETIVGVYGTRGYEDKTTVPSITFQVEDKILSFIASNKR